MTPLMKNLRGLPFINKIANNEQTKTNDGYTKHWRRPKERWWGSR